MAAPEMEGRPRAWSSLLTIYSVPGTVPNTCTHCLAASANNPLNKGLPDHVTPMAFTQGSCLPHARSSPHPHSLSHSLRAAFLAPEHRGSGSPQGLCTPSFLCWNSFPGGWLFLTQEGQFVCYFHQEASLDPPPFKVGPFLYQPAFSFFLPAFSS